MSAQPKSNPLQNTIIYIDRDKLSFCDNKSGTSQIFPYPPESVKDLEVKNLGLLSTQLKLYIDSHHLAPTNLVFVLSPSLYFEANLTKLSEEQRQAETQKFLDTIPFASVISKLYHLNNEYKLVAINGDFFEALQTIFTSVGFQVTALAPLFIFGNLDQKPELNADFCRIVTRRMDFILDNSFISPHPEDQSLTIRQRHFLNKHNLVFALLSLVAIVLLIGTAFFTLRRPAKVKPVPVPVVVRPRATLAPSLTPTPTLVATDSSQLTVSLRTSAQSKLQATKITPQLTGLGLTNITSVTIPATTSGTFVIYSPRVPATLRLNLMKLLTDLSFSPKVSENANSAIDITISF